MALAAAFPNLPETADREAYMQSLVTAINGIEAAASDPLTPTPEMEAEWAANRAALAQMFGRIQ